MEALLKDTMSPLDRLFRLQEVLLKVQRKSERRERTPDHLAHIEAAYRDARRLREEAAAGLGRATTRKNGLDDEISDLAEKLKKYQQQLQSVKTNKEYGALLNEIDTVKREIRSREDEILALDEALAASAAEAVERDAAFPVEEAGYEEQMKEWRAEQAVLAEEIAQAERLAAELREALDRRLVATFDRIARVRSGVAIAKVEMVGLQTAACSACHVRLRPQLLSDLRLSKDTILCESCKRILYWDGREQP